MTPSLLNFFWGLFWGALVLGLLGGAIVLASQKDKIVRRG